MSFWIGLFHIVQHGTCGILESTNISFYVVAGLESQPTYRCSLRKYLCQCSFRWSHVVYLSDARDVAVTVQSKLLLLSRGGKRVRREWQMVGKGPARGAHSHKLSLNWRDRGAWITVGKCRTSRDTVAPRESATTASSRHQQPADNLTIITL